MRRKAYDAFATLVLAFICGAVAFAASLLITSCAERRPYTPPLLEYAAPPMPRELQLSNEASGPLPQGNSRRVLPVRDRGIKRPKAQ